MLGRNRSARSGVAALEFALAAPAMTVILFGIVDLGQALVAMRRVTTVAWQTGEVVTELAVQPDQTTVLTPARLYQGSTVIYSIFPELRGTVVTDPTRSTYAVTVSDVVFAPTRGGCVGGLTCTDYTAQVAWSVALDKGQPLTRGCGTQSQVSPTAKSTMSNVPTLGMTKLKSAIVVDVLYQFTPFFGAFVTGPMPIRRTALINQRSIAQDYVTYDTQTNPSVCPGYV